MIWVWKGASKWVVAQTCSLLCIEMIEYNIKLAKSGKEKNSNCLLIQIEVTDFKWLSFLNE